MYFQSGLTFFLCVGVMCAQSSEPPEITKAKTGLQELRALVEAGAAPRAQLERAEEAMADAEDAVFLRHTLYGEDLSEEQSDEMVAAAVRRFERRKQAVRQAQQLVKQGVASQLSLGTFLEDADRAQREYDLAVSRAKLVRELAAMAQAEKTVDSDLEQAPSESLSVAERFDGNGIFTPRDLKKISAAFASQFAKSLPVSAFGETAVHRALGFDHRNRVDVAVHPDQPEGVWLRRFLATCRIPYFAFRHAVPGKATAAHIHIGPMSGRIVRGG